MVVFCGDVTRSGTAVALQVCEEGGAVGAPRGDVVQGDGGCLGALRCYGGAEGGEFGVPGLSHFGFGFCDGGEVMMDGWMDGWGGFLCRA